MVTTMTTIGTITVAKATNSGMGIGTKHISSRILKNVDSLSRALHVADVFLREPAFSKFFNHVGSDQL